MESRTILVVDDDDEIRNLIQIRLTQLGHFTVTAPDGVKAIEAMDVLNFDVLITDVLMPAKDGLELIRDVQSKKLQTRIVAISGGGGKGSRSYYLDCARDLGAEVVLGKPFSNSELAAAVAAVLSPRPLD